VDDADVDRYGEQLSDMNHSIGLARGRLDRVQFRSLVDLFSLHQAESSSPQRESYSDMADRLRIAALDHHVPTSVTEEAELCRRILMAGCKPPRAEVRALIESRDAAVLALYRGFSRFMLEDLELHPFMQKISRSKQKKISCEVAFEMILVRLFPFIHLSYGMYANALNRGTNPTRTSWKCSSLTTYVCLFMRKLNPLQPTLACNYP